MEENKEDQIGSHKSEDSYTQCMSPVPEEKKMDQITDT